MLMPGLALDRLHMDGDIGETVEIGFDSPEACRLAAERDERNDVAWALRRTVTWRLVDPEDPTGPPDAFVPAIDISTVEPFAVWKDTYCVTAGTLVRTLDGTTYEVWESPERVREEMGWPRRTAGGTR